MKWFSKSNNPPDSASVNPEVEEKDLQKVNSNNESLETSEKKDNASFWSMIGFSSSEKLYNSLEHCLSHANNKEKVANCMEKFKEEKPKEEKPKEEKPKEEESKDEESKDEEEKEE